MTPDEAIKMASEVTPERVRDLARRSILGENPAPPEHRFVVEASEDFAVHLLESGDTSPDVRDAVIRACEELYGELLRDLASPVGDVPIDEKKIETAERLCRVVDLTGPEELRGRAGALLTLALGDSRIPQGVLAAAVRAAMAYQLTDANAPFWEEIARRPQVAAYGFNALLKINPRASRIANLLVELWVKQLREDWNVDMPFLLRRTVRARSSDAIVSHVLEKLHDELVDLTDGAQLIGKVVADLKRRKWSKAWVDTITSCQAKRFPEYVAGESSISRYTPANVENAGTPFASDIRLIQVVKNKPPTIINRRASQAKKNTPRLSSDFGQMYGASTCERTTKGNLYSAYDSFFQERSLQTALSQPMNVARYFVISPSRIPERNLVFNHS